MEILHTWLLGQEKYVWFHTYTQWNVKQEELFAQRLESSSIDGLNIFPVRGTYLVKYKNSLVGKQFKTLQQVGIFHLHGKLASEKVLRLWRTTGELGALLWYPSISNLEQYLVSSLPCSRQYKMKSYPFEERSTDSD